MAAATDRHLLFGLIALQVGPIDQAQLVAAFQAWARDKSRSLADHLADRGGPDSEGRAAVETMVALQKWCSSRARTRRDIGTTWSLDFLP